MDDVMEAIETRQRRVRQDFEQELRDQEELRTQLFDLFAAGRTQRSVAREAGMSDTTLSQWMKGKYKGDEIGIYNKLRTWHENQQVATDARLSIPDTWVETETGRNIERTLMFAQTEPTIVVIYGGAGVGKTTGIARYQRANPNVWVMASDPSSAAMGATLGQLAAALGLRGLPHIPHQMSRDVIQRLRGTRGLLVVDEAQHLSVSALEQLRAVHDSAGIGLCLSGNEDVYAKMTGGNRKAVFAQLFSRIGARLSLPSPTIEDVDAILAEWNIEGDKEVKFGRQIALLPGGLRGLFQCLRQANMKAIGVNAPVDVRSMRAAWRDLGGDV